MLIKKEPYIVKKVVSKLMFVLNSKKCPVYPRELWIEPTTRCNIRCITCEKYLKPPGLDFDMEPEVYEEIRQQILPYVHRIYIVGLGEPLFAPLFQLMVDDCIKLGIKFSYTTNGVLLNEELVEKTVRYGFGIALSVDGARKETFESIRKGMKFETILEKMRIIKAVLAKYRPREFDYSWNVVGMTRNISELPELLELAGKNGVKSITVFNFGVGGRDDELARESLSGHPEIAKKYFTLAQAVAHKWRINLIFPSYSSAAGVRQIKATEATQSSYSLKDISRLCWALNEGERFMVAHQRRCYSPWYHVYVRYNGDIWPCCMYSTYSLGNIKTTNFPEIWNGETYREFRRRIHSGNPAYWCARCNLPWGITGGDENFSLKQREVNQ